ncbi:MAG: hypothetical protein K0R60_1113, partial [Microbacterium sp.]|nr:hypothetical protein [Microbacterium sp.]
MQCWGDDASGGPDRTTCQFGGANKPGATRTQTNIEVAPEDAPFSHVGTDFADPTFTGIPFRSVTGKVIAGVDQDGKVIKNVDLNNNEFFTQYTTNEVSWAGSGADGTGDITFEVQTTLASPGLGCGAVAEGASTPRPCWLVAVPRGEGNNVESGIAWEQWKHRLAVRLDFQQVGSRCAIGAAERQLAGSELVSDAVSSWQPVLCNSGDTAFTLLSTTESDSAAQANTIPDAPLALTSYAIDPSAGVADGLTYAPIGLTGIAITFAIDRKPLSSAPQEVRDRARRAFTEMKLTPRLVAKLLTSSYLDALPTDADRSHLGGGANPRNLLKDPEFLALNDPEWGEQAIVGAVADVMVPQGRSGALRALWTYVWADAEARDFLAGGADPYGMTVNPYASTDPAKNANQNGSALELPRDDAP